MLKGQNQNLLINRICPNPLMFLQGAKGHWLWGNVFDINKAIEQFREWQKQYGDIYRLNIAGLKVIMVSRPKLDVLYLVIEI